MTTLWFLIGFLVLAVAGLGLGLWQLVRVRRHGRRAAPAELAEAAPRRSYGPMARLFDGRDLEFLQSQRGWRPMMATRLRLERRAVLSLYLRQVRAEFRQHYRAAAPRGESSEFAAAAARQFLVFYALYAVLRAHCFLGLFVFVRTDVGSLLAVLRRLQERAQQAVGQQPARSRAATAR